MKNPKNSIRLTNKTAKNLRKQAVQQKYALYAAAVVLSIVLAGAGVVLGMQHIVFLPLMLLIALGMDILIMLLARGRYLSLIGQAICTEAAARQIKSGSAEQARIETARRDLERIKKDLAMDDEDEGEDEDDDEQDEGDEDMYAPGVKIPHKRDFEDMPLEMIDTRAHRPVSMPVEMIDTRAHAPVQDFEDTHVQTPVQRRRRQARLQVLVSDTPDNKAN